MVTKKCSHGSFPLIIVIDLWLEGWGWVQKGPKAIGFHSNQFAVMAIKKYDFECHLTDWLAPNLKKKVGSQSGDDVRLLVSMATNLLPWQPKKWCLTGHIIPILAWKEVQGCILKMSLVLVTNRYGNSKKLSGGPMIFCGIGGQQYFHGPGFYQCHQWASQRPLPISNSFKLWWVCHDVK